MPWHDKNQLKISSSTSKSNPETAIWDPAIIKENLNSIAKFELSASLVQYIDSHLIFYSVHINNFTILPDIKLNLHVLNCFKSYQLSPTLVIYKILEVFCNKFYK